MIDENVTCVSMGFNTQKGDPKWDEAVAKFKRTVETNGCARASWGVTGRTMHHMLACQLKEALKSENYEWTIDYGSYLCYAQKGGIR